MGLLSELRRRNVFRVAIAYFIIAWLVLQVGDTLAPALHLGEWVNSALAFFLILGFPIALFFAWAFELTPEGLKKDKDVDRSASITHITGRKLDFAIISALVLALGYFAYDKFVIEAEQEGDSDQKIVTTAVQHSIAVLPFVNMSTDPEQEYFSDGLSDEILNLLAKIPSLKVIGRTSSFAFKGKNEDLRVIGEKLNVKTLLEGSVRKSGDRVRITAQLIDVTDGAHIWSQTYDRTMSDIFAVQDDVAAAIIDALQIHIGASPTRRRPTDNTEAYSLFLKASVLFDGNGEESRKLLLSATALDPEFAEAYELLARMHWNSAEQQPAAEAAAKALAIDPDLVLAQAVFEAAEIGSHLANIEAFEQALRKQPDNPLLLQALAWNLTQAGYFREALSLARRWVDVDPLSVWANRSLAFSLDVAGRTSEAVAAGEISDQLEGAFRNWRKGEASLRAGQDEQAIAYFETSWKNNNLPLTDASWIRDLITRARDPATGQAYLDHHIPEVNFYTMNADPENLHTWYLYFGFIDRYFELLLENDPNDARWAAADFYLYNGIIEHVTGFTAHPMFLEVADTMGLIKIWNKRGPPDICENVGGQWVCE